MSKLEKGVLPPNHSLEDLTCMGPPAVKDGEFDDSYMADMGCFLQPDDTGRDVDSNKYYHIAVVESAKSPGQFGVYAEWGRVGATNPQWQFIEWGVAKDQAHAAFAKQCHAKNDKRGVWKKIGDKKILVAKPGDDVYKIRQLQCRTVGLKSGRNISAGGPITAPAVVGANKKAVVRSTSSVDRQTSALLKDLAVGTVSYAKTSLEGGNIPAMPAIVDARDLLVEVQKRLAIVGDDAMAQVKDKIIRQLTYDLYARIPKKKDQKVGPEKWILNKDNILQWGLDLDAFESAIHSDVSTAEIEENPFGDLPLDKMIWLDPNSELGKFIHEWLPNASGNRHNIGKMKIANVWQVERKGDDKLFENGLERCRSSSMERPPFQPKSRPDLTRDLLKRYVASNVHLLCHGTRTVNVSGILRTMLRFPKDLPKHVQIAGAAFGPGSYFADDWRKSAGYTSMRGSHWSAGGGRIENRGAFMFLMDVALGTPWIAPSSSEAQALDEMPPKGHNCIYGKAKHEYNTGTKKYTDYIQNNEWIIFERNQSKIGYVVEFDTESRY